MSDLPMWRHKKSGDIVFAEARDPRKTYVRLPSDYWKKEYAKQGKATKIRDIKAEAARRILNAWPLYKQLNALHNPDEPWAAVMRADILKIRKWSNDAEAKLAGGNK